MLHMLHYIYETPELSLMAGERGWLASRTHLCNQEVHILLNKDIDLLLEDGLDLLLALAAQVRGGLRDPPSHQGVPLVGHFPGQVAGGLVDLRPLRVRERNNLKTPPAHGSFKLGLHAAAQLPGPGAAAEGVNSR